jgi:hypothetical protein
VRIHVGNPEVLPELIRYFQGQGDCLVLQVGEKEIEVSLLGSYRLDRHDAVIEQRLAGFWTRSNGKPSKVDFRPANGNGKPQPGPAVA